MTDNIGMKRNDIRFRNISEFADFATNFYKMPITIISICFGIGMLNYSITNELAQSKRLIEDLGEVQKIQSDSIDPLNEGRLVHLSGVTKVKNPLKDELFNLSFEAIVMNRKVEVYNADEVYSKRWKEVNGSAGKYSANRYPPSLLLHAKEIKVKGYNLPKSMLLKLNNFKNYSAFPDEQVFPTFMNEKPIIKEDYLFYGKDFNNPKTGNFRVSYQIIEPTIVSIMAKQEGRHLVSFPFQKKRPFKKPFSLLMLGERSPEYMFAHYATVDIPVKIAMFLFATFFIFVGVRHLVNLTRADITIIPLFQEYHFLNIVTISLIASIVISVLLYVIAKFGIEIDYGFLFIITFGLTVSCFKLFMENFAKKQKTASRDNLHGKYYLIIKNEKRGPFTVKQIENLLLRGRISHSTLCQSAVGEETQPVGMLVNMAKAA